MTSAKNRGDNDKNGGHNGKIKMIRAKNRGDNDKNGGDKGKNRRDGVIRAKMVVIMAKIGVITAKWGS